MFATRRALAAFALVLAASEPALAADADKYDVDNVRGISRFMELYGKATAAQRERRTDDAI